MASEQDDTVFNHDLDDDDDESSQPQDDDDDVLADEEEEEEEEEDLNSVSLSPSSPPSTVPLAIPSAVTVAADPPSVSTDPIPDPKRPRVEYSIVAVEEKRPPQPPPMDESRRLFQRLWTDEDEIELLQGFLEYTTQRGSNHHDTALFYDQIKSKLQLDFNKNQLVEKLRRLKKKYRNVLDKLGSGKDFNFKSPHDQATFEISRKIWSSIGKIAGGEDANLDDDDANPNPIVNHNHHHLFHDDVVKIEDQKSTPRSRKRSRSRSGSAVKVEDKQTAFVANTDNNGNNSNFIGNSSNSTLNVSGLTEETVRSCLSPLFKEFLSNMMAAGGPCSGRGIGGLAMNAMPLSFGGGEMMVDEKWRKQQILELEVYSKRLELVQEQIRAQLEELRSMGG